MNNYEQLLTLFWCGATLAKAERAIFTKRRKEAYEALHPETRQGGDRRSEASRQVGDLVDRFTADTATRTGQSERSVQRDAHRGEKIAPTQPHHHSN